MAMNFSLMSDEEKEMLQSLVNEAEMVKPSEAIKCANCQHTPIKLYISADCMHLFCKKCFRLLQEGLCPECGIALLADFYLRNTVYEGRISQLEVYCNFKRNGCKEILPIKKLLGHCKKCKYLTRELLPKEWNELGKQLFLQDISHEILVMKQTIHQLQEKLSNNETENAKIPQVNQLLRELRIVEEITEVPRINEKIDLESKMGTMLENFTLLLKKTEQDLQKRMAVHEAQIRMFQNAIDESNSKMRALESKIRALENKIPTNNTPLRFWEKNTFSTITPPVFSFGGMSNPSEIHPHTTNNTPLHVLENAPSKSQPPVFSLAGTSNPFEFQARRTGKTIRKSKIKIQAN